MYGGQPFDAKILDITRFTTCQNKISVLDWRIWEDGERERKERRRRLKEVCLHLSTV